MEKRIDTGICGDCVVILVNNKIIEWWPMTYWGEDEDALQYALKKYSETETETETES